ncbi:hypothetical protein [Dyadobacter sediminis]|uniref:Uncharacterized protein n=1 Tax=Dyadobacter sediminis TaxID=1493691 RepID=A0A5R9KIM4_9BACT|nr:hypothetical protein [Dyadobacter sediminis]TLU96070.1 hypothetical protein FEM55_02665 [Dyadobacter sediminis]
MNASFYFPNFIKGQKRQNTPFHPALQLNRDYPKTDNPIIQPAPIRKETSTRSTSKDGTDTPKQPVKRKPSR